MAYDEGLAERIRALVSSERAVEKKMFGGLAFLVGGHLAVSASGQGGLLVHVDPADDVALLAESGASQMEMGGRGPMRGWLRVSADAVAEPDDLRRWVDRGVAYARSQPPK